MGRTIHDTKEKVLLYSSPTGICSVDEAELLAQGLGFVKLSALIFVH